jgi:pimeloyl-ACP methyl ester carboxylesterase
LLIQGVGMAGAAWQPQIEGLADRFRVVAFDNRGLDGSNIDLRMFSIETMALDALAVMDAVGAARWHVVGHSMGGLIAQELALRAPQRVQSLAFLCTFHRGSEATRLSPGLLWRGLRTRIGSRPMRRQAFLEMIFPPSVLAGTDRDALAAQMRQVIGRDLADPPAIAMAQLRAMGRYNASERLGQLGGIPSLVVSATDDRIALPEYGRRLASAIPGARFVELSGAGHALPIQSPRKTNQLLGAHFEAASLDRAARAQ